MRESRQKKSFSARGVAVNTSGSDASLTDDTGAVLLEVLSGVGTGGRNRPLALSAEM